ncbi:MAG: hypothetical protein RMA76_13580 [Deltaproteobacteria bacterium]
MRWASVVALVCLAGCASHRRAGLHLNPLPLFEAALAEHGGFSAAPGAAPSKGRKRPVLVLPFGDRTLAPHGSYLDEREAVPVAEIYVVPNLVEHLRDRTVDGLRSGGASVFVVSDRASAPGSEALAGVELDRLEVTIDAFEIHRWERDEQMSELDDQTCVDLVRVVYRYRWGGGVVRTGTHRLLIRTDVDALDVVAQYLVHEITGARS